MTRARTQYKLVGRYLNGNDTKYYGLASEENKQVEYTSEQMAFMVGRGQVVNVGAQIYQGRLLFRGQNCDIKSLPTIQLRKDKDTGVVTAQHKGLAKVKEVLVSKQDYLKQFFSSKFNMTLDFHITADDSKLSITDSAGVLKNYDINFSDSNGQVLTIYRQMDDRWINIGAVPLKSTPQAVVKNALVFVYKDSLLD